MFEVSFGGTLVSCSVQVFWVQVNYILTLLSFQILPEGGAVEDGHQNTGRVSPFSDPGSGTWSFQTLTPSDPW